MSDLADQFHKLKLVMDETMTFPTDYQYKFIVPVAELPNILKILDGMNLTQEESKTGKYISITAKARMNSSSDIISVYKNVSYIKGIISL